MPLPPQRPTHTPPAVPAIPLDPTPAIGQPVNDFSRVVQPSEQFPLHFDFLMNDIYRRGIEPEQWQVIAADEVRLDEDGMDVEFTLIRVGTDHVWRRRINVERGRLVGIVER